MWNKDLWLETNLFKFFIITCCMGEEYLHKPFRHTQKSAINWTFTMRTEWDLKSNRNSVILPKLYL